MDYLVRHGRELFLLVIFPFVGLGLEIGLSSKAIRYLIIVSLVLMTPALFKYAYIIPNAFQLLGVILLACVYSIFSRRVQKQVFKFITATLFTALLVAILGYAYFIDSMAGTQTTEGKWSVNGYQIKYIKDQGFSGAPLMTYELSKISTIPLFIKRIETVVENDSISKCKINFESSRIAFDKCNLTLTQNAR